MPLFFLTIVLMAFTGEHIVKFIRFDYMTFDFTIFDFKTFDSITFGSTALLLVICLVITIKVYRLLNLKSLPSYIKPLILRALGRSKHAN